ncbi:gluconolactonase [Sphingomonas sp. NFR04]|nr:gluconolactonase [Sphingomonas sp. NFR04]
MAMVGDVQDNRVLAKGLDQPEGPAILPNGDLLLVEMGEARACVTRVDRNGGHMPFARPGGRPTGLAIDGDGCIWAAGGTGNSLVRLSPTGELLLTIAGDEHGPFLFPNDLAFGPDGMLYMTDSGMIPGDLIQGLVIRPDFADAPYDGRVFQIDPRAGRVTRRLATGLRFANGVAFGSDGALYYNETLTSVIYRQEPGREATPFARLDRQAAPDRFAGPDGMAFDAAGRLYCAVYGEGRVAVLDPSGKAMPSIRTNGDRPTNVAFAREGTALFITEVQHGAVEVVSADDVGLALHQPLISTSEKGCAHGL